VQLFNLRGVSILLQKYLFTSHAGKRAILDGLMTEGQQDTWSDLVVVDGFTPDRPRDALVWLNAVSEDYFGAIGSTLLAGRAFDRHDGPDAARGGREGGGAGSLCAARAGRAVGALP